MGHKIRSFGPYLGVPIYKDNNVMDHEKVYIGNGQGCGTFWFRTVEEAKKFIEKYRKRIKLTDLSIVGGLIPRRLCRACACHYSYGSKKWRETKEWNCHPYKEELKKRVLARAKSNETNIDRLDRERNERINRIEARARLRRLNRESSVCCGEWRGNSALLCRFLVGLHIGKYPSGRPRAHGGLRLGELS